MKHINYLGNESRYRVRPFCLHRMDKWLLSVAAIILAGTLSCYSATYVVSNINDEGTGSLRWAISNANASADDDVINFDPAVFVGEQRIELSGVPLEVQNNGTLTINGPGQDTSVWADQLQVSQVFIFQGSTALIRDIKIVGGLFNGLGTVLNDQGSVTLTGCVVSGTSDRGGSVLNRGTMVIEGGEIGGYARLEGGAIYNQGDLTITHAIIIGSTNGSGGGIYNASGSVILHETTLRDGLSSLSGGAIENSGSAAIFNSELSGNYAMAEGGAISNSGSCFLSGSTIHTNRVEQGEGGGISNSGEMTMVNSTISRNQGLAAISNRAGTIRASNVTIAFNDRGGVHNVGAATFIAKNDLLSNNGASDISDFDGNLESLGYNLILDDRATIISGVLDGNILGRDPLLDPVLRQNGGLTPTHAPLGSSPALDRGASTDPVLATDQRGLSRQYDHPRVPNAVGGDGSDIGAVERQELERAAFPLFDYDRDGAADISIFRPSAGEWYVRRSTEGLYGARFGYGDDRIAPADYDGDGRTDIAVYRPSTGIWYVLESSNLNVSYYDFGIEEDLPVPGDYDGDGKADVSVFRPSDGTWYRQNSYDGSFLAMQFGTTGDKPALGDYDGDGKDDLAVFRPSTGAWYRTYSSDSSLHADVFGNSADIIVQADYDGDGKTDIAVYRQPYWYVRNSPGPLYTSYPFGIPGDIPAPSDINGDGKADIVVFRPSNGTWYRAIGSYGSFIAYPFGTNGDKPTQTAFRY